MSDTGIALAKPPVGSPCNGCGRCCQDRLCDLGQRVFERLIGPCPALEPNEGAPGFHCGLMTRPARYVPMLTKKRGNAAMAQAARVILAAGWGCDARLTDEVWPPDYAERAERRNRDEAAEIAAARPLWDHRQRTPDELRKAAAHAGRMAEIVGAAALAEGLSADEMLRLRHEQLSRRAYAGALRAEIAKAATT